MGIRTTHAGFVRARGVGSRKSEAAPGVMAATLAVTFDAAQAAGTSTNQWLPRNAIILHVDLVSGVTGGTSPLVDIGLNNLIADPDGIIDGASASANARVALGDAGIGALVGGPLPQDAEIVAGTGGGTPGVGNVTAYITYTFLDDGAIAS